MHDVLAACFEGPKSQARATHVNVVTGQKGYLLHVLDKQSGTKFLVDGGAIRSIIPPTPRQRLEGPNGTKLSAADVPAG